MRYLFLVLLPLLAGCAHHPLDCAAGIVYDDCLPGTLGYDRLVGNAPPGPAYFNIPQPQPIYVPTQPAPVMNFGDNNRMRTNCTTYRVGNQMQTNCY